MGIEDDKAAGQPQGKGNWYGRGGIAVAAAVTGVVGVAVVPEAAVRAKQSILGVGRDISHLFDDDDPTGGTGDGGGMLGGSGGEGALKFMAENPEWVVIGGLIAFLIGYRIATSRRDEAAA
jgi:hypothetical protein